MINSTPLNPAFINHCFLAFAINIAAKIAFNMTADVISDDE